MDRGLKFIFFFRYKLHSVHTYISNIYLFVPGVCLTFTCNVQFKSKQPCTDVGHSYKLTHKFTQNSHVFQDFVVLLTSLLYKQANRWTWKTRFSLLTVRQIHLCHDEHPTHVYSLWQFIPHKYSKLTKCSILQVFWLSQMTWTPVKLHNVWSRWKQHTKQCWYHTTWQKLTLWNLSEYCRSVLDTCCSKEAARRTLR